MKKIKIISVLVVYEPENINKIIDLVSRLSVYSKILVIINDGNSYSVGQDHIICNNKNVGTSGAYNIAINTFKEDYDFIWIWDQDSSVDSENLSKFYNNVCHYKNLNKIGAYLFYDSRNKIKSNDLHFNNIEYGKSSGTLITKELINAIGNFNEDLFLDYVDYEFMIRAEQHGFKLVSFEGIELNSHQLGGLYASLFGEIQAPAPYRLFLQKKSVSIFLKIVKGKYLLKLKLLLRLFLWVPWSFVFKDCSLRLYYLLIHNEK